MRSTESHIANVNSNHAQVRSGSSNEVSSSLVSGLSGTKPVVKSKVVKLDKQKVQPEVVVQFEEDGELIEMEIDDGGAAATEFASEADNEETQEKQFTQPSDSESKSEVESDDENNISVVVDDQSQSEGELMGLTPPKKSKKKHKSTRKPYGFMQSSFGISKSILHIW